MVIPIGDQNPVRRAPLVTYLLLLLNIGVFFTEPVPVLPELSGPPQLAQACEQEAYFRRWGAIPREVVTNDPLDETAGPAVPGQGCRTVPRDYPKSPALSVLTSMFLHGGLLHLLGNMLFLAVFGNNVEDRLGRLRFLLFYLGCGYAAAYGFAFAFPDSTTALVGASGAVAGVLGAYLRYFPRARVTSLLPFVFFLPARLPAWIVLGSWFLLQWVYAQGAGLADSSGGGVAYQAHVVGFLTGFVFALLVRGTPLPAALRNRYVK